jgi:hypothetical protein
MEILATVCSAAGYKIYKRTISPTSLGRNFPPRRKINKSSAGFVRRKRGKKVPSLIKQNVASF